jgi:dTDP-4-amino-4,6-dideoxygalactose transaminase
MAAAVPASTRSGAPVSDPLVPFQRPEPPPPEAIMAYYERSRDEGFYANGGPNARDLAARLADYVGGDAFAIPVGNCTVGLMVALRAACGMPAGERRLIVTPSYTFTATACAIEWAGFEPVFVDIERRGWHMEPAALEAAFERFGGKIAGVLACAAFGTAPAPTQRAAWRELCDAHDVPLLIDSAPGFGSRTADGTPLGGLGDTEISFHATKPFAVGEGGLITTADADLAARIGRMINFGLEPGTRISADIGMNAKMSELHAATAMAMLDRIGGVVVARQRNAARLRDAIGPDANLQYQAGAERSTWQIFHVLCPTPEMRDRCVELAPRHGIQVRTMHDPALHTHPAFAGARRGPLPVTEAAAERALALPMANVLDDGVVERIAGLVHAARSAPCGRRIAC